jgi:predicted nucleic acid-binding protein
MENPLRKLDMSEEDIIRLTKIAENTAKIMGLTLEEVLNSMSSCTRT